MCIVISTQLSSSFKEDYEDAPSSESSSRWRFRYIFFEQITFVVAEASASTLRIYKSDARREVTGEKFSEARRLRADDRINTCDFYFHVAR